MNLIGKTICQRSGGNGKENVGRNLVGDSVETFLNTAQRILQTQIKRGAFFRRQVPDLFTFCDTDAQVKHHPGLADLRCTAEHGHTLRQQCFDTKPGRYKSHVHECFTVYDSEFVFGFIHFKPILSAIFSDTKTPAL